MAPARGLSIGTQHRSARFHFPELEEGGFQMIGAALEDSHILPVTADALPWRRRREFRYATSMVIDLPNVSLPRSGPGAACPWPSQPNGPASSSSCCACMLSVIEDDLIAA